MNSHLPWACLPTRSLFIIFFNSIKDGYNKVKDIALIIAASVVALSAYFEYWQYLAGIIILVTLVFSFFAFQRNQHCLVNGVFHHQQGVFNIKYDQLNLHNNLRMEVKQGYLERILKLYSCDLYNSGSSKPAINLMYMSKEGVELIESAIGQSTFENKLDDNICYRMSPIQHFLALPLIPGWKYFLGGAVAFIGLSTLLSEQEFQLENHSAEVMKSNISDTFVQLLTFESFIVLVLSLYGIRAIGKAIFYLPSIVGFTLRLENKVFSGHMGLLKKTKWSIPIAEITSIELKSRFGLEWLGYYCVNFIATSSSSEKSFEDAMAKGTANYCIPCIHKDDLGPLLNSMGYNLPSNKNYSRAPLRYALLEFLNFPGLLLSPLILVMLPITVFEVENTVFLVAFIKIVVLTQILRTTLGYANYRTAQSESQLSIGSFSTLRELRLIPMDNIQTIHRQQSILHKKGSCSLTIGAGMVGSEIHHLNASNSKELMDCLPSNLSDIK